MKITLDDLEALRGLLPGELFLIVLWLPCAVRLSSLTQRLKHLTQEVALLRGELELRRGQSPSPGVA